VTDRELLERAAKAAGLEVISYHAEGPHNPVHLVVQEGDWSFPWNPLTEASDALRLAVKTGEPFVVRTRCVTTMGGLKEDFDPDIADDDVRATCRVIVRAAAALGDGHG
jgi:hypothetical protein